MPPLVHLPREMTSEERAQKFQTDKMSLLIGWREFHCGATNQTHYPPRSGWRNVISMEFPQPLSQTSFHEEIIDRVAKSRLFSRATDLDVGAFACSGSKIKLATVFRRQGRVRIRRYDSFCKLIVRSNSTHATELYRKFASGTHSFQRLWQWTTAKKLTLEFLWRGFGRRQSTFVSSALTDRSSSCTLEQRTS